MKTKNQKRIEAEERHLNSDSKTIFERIDEVKKRGGSKKELARLEEQRDKMEFGNILKESKPKPKAKLKSKGSSKFKKSKSNPKKRNVQKVKQKIGE